MTSSQVFARSDGLPKSDLEKALGISAKETKDVLEFDIARTDIGEVKGPEGVQFSPAFEIGGSIFLQSLPKHKAILNGDMALLPDEVNPFIRSLLANGLTVQAFHQHFPMMQPQIWYVHFRGKGDPLQLVKSTRIAFSKTAIPFPQTSSKSKSPLDAKRLGKILHGEAEVGEDGVVTVLIPLKNPMKLDGVTISPQLNVSTHVDFKPTGGNNAIAVPDFAMTASQIDPVLKRMTNDQNWLLGCLYNQETDEEPQLFFSHLLKQGDAYQLAEEIRKGLDLTGAD